MALKIKSHAIEQDEDYYYLPYLYVGPTPTDPRPYTLHARDSIFAQGADGSVSYYAPSGNALFRCTTANATDVGYVDFPRLHFRDPSDGYAGTISIVNSRVGVGVSSPLAKLHVVGGFSPAASSGQLRLQSSSCTGTYWDIFHNAADGVGEFGLVAAYQGLSYVAWAPPYYQFGRHDAAWANLLIYGNGTGSAQGGRLSLYNAADYDGVFQYWGFDVYQDDLRFFQSSGEVRLLITPTEFVVNSIQGDYDFRAASINNDHMLNVDAANDRVGVGIANPGSTLHVVGGMQIGSPTGGDQGAGTLNVDIDIYKDGVAYNNPDYVFEHWLTGDIVKFADKPGADEYESLSIHKARDYIAENMHLPGMGGPGGIFIKGERLLEWIERLTIYLFEHEDRLAVLEGTNGH